MPAFTTATVLGLAGLALGAASTGYNVSTSREAAREGKDATRDVVNEAKSAEDLRKKQELENQKNMAAMAASRARRGMMNNAYSNKGGTILTGQLGAPGAAPVALKTGLGA